MKGPFDGLQSTLSSKLGFLEGPRGPVRGLVPLQPKLNATQRGGMEAGLSSEDAAFEIEPKPLQLLKPNCL